jgi:hypothetical protein
LRDFHWHLAAFIDRLVWLRLFYRVAVAADITLRLLIELNNSLNWRMQKPQNTRARIWGEPATT